jgi:3-hydroxyisobutyrate dehydrogenase
MPEDRIAFLGLGIMGTGMATRLVEAGFPLSVYNRTQARAAALAQKGARVASSPADAVRAADIVIAMVADDAASRQIWSGQDGALNAVRRGALLIECSTLSVSWVKELATLAVERGCELLDAPVTGSKPQAAAGELNFLVGGSDSGFQRAQPLLSAMGRSITHLGPTGSGAMVKLINNFVCGVQLVSIAEAIALIERTGLDCDKALGVLTNGAPGSPMVKTVSARMTAHQYTPNFLLRLMAKDLDYAMREAQTFSLDLATAAAALHSLRLAIPAHADQDMSSVIEIYRAKKSHADL